MTDAVLHPLILWAQRTDKLFVTIALQDLENPKLDLTEDKLYFKGKGGKEQMDYEAEIEFYDSIVPEKSTRHVTSREMVITIMRKSPGPYWPKLNKGKKLSFLKTDFNKWKDEDDSEDESSAPGMGGGNLEEMMAQMGGAGGDFPGLDDLNQGSEDSDDEELPDLEDATTDDKS